MDRVARLKELLTLTPGDSFLEHALALEHVKAGDDAGARLLFEGILAREPGYTGSYYHLGKLLERSGDPATAMRWYQQGMAACKAAGDNHAFNELRAAFEDLEE